MEKDMMNPMNWGVDEVKEAATTIAMLVPCFIFSFIIMWIIY